MILVNVVFAQERTRLEIINADYTYFDQQSYPDIRRLVGNVIFNHNGAIMNCDSAWYYFKENRFEAFGNIHINQGDTLHLYGKKLNYDGAKQKAIVKDDIVLKDKTMKLLTDEIHYYLETNIASYYSRAKITNRDNILMSDKGDYISESNFLIFKDNVTLTNPSYLITCDTLHFNTESEIAYFFGPTRITSDNNLIYCENGWYNTLTDRSQFSNNAYMWSDNQKLSGDSLYYDRNKGYGLAINNIQIQDTLNDYSIYGNKAEYFENLDSSIITETPLLVADFEEDTLFLHSDTIVANLDSLNYQQIKAFTMANFYSENLQGKAEELIYFMRDSTIQLFRNPILWSDDYQLSSEHIILYLKENAIEQLEMLKNAFIISKDSLELYNQIKGKNMTGFFKRNELYKINVKGNGQTVYVIKDEEDKITGINTISCSQMNIGISEKTINRISFQTLPNSIIYPIEELPNEWKRLNGFEDRFNERVSTKEDIWDN
ncbi:hypothetical protein N8962_01735 [Flavobacteriales bacterium]|nr:hypothetical protein [Flavobacteriales bacterium]